MKYLIAATSTALLFGGVATLMIAGPEHASVLIAAAWIGLLVADRS